jgi:hypothetical protein
MSRKKGLAKMSAAKEMTAAVCYTYKVLLVIPDISEN